MLHTADGKPTKVEDGDFLVISLANGSVAIQIERNNLILDLNGDNLVALRSDGNPAAFIISFLKRVFSITRPDLVMTEDYPRSTETKLVFKIETPKHA